jgi:hypothetical protein
MEDHHLAGTDQLRADLPLPRDARGAARRDRRQHPAGGMIASRVRRVLTRPQPNRTGLGLSWAHARAAA